MEFASWEQLYGKALAPLSPDSQQAFLLLWDRLHNEVVNLFFHQLCERNPNASIELAEDLTCELRDRLLSKFQDVACTNLRVAFESRAYAINYIRQCVGNAIVDDYRRNRRFSQIEEGVEYASGSDVVEELINSNIRSIVATAAKTAVDKVLGEAKLKDRQIYEAVVKSDGQQGEKFVSVSAALNIPKDTLRKRYYLMERRCKEEVRAEIERQGLE